jgi:glycosyltransferase involved in cell wall biosynthesis
LLAKYDVLSQTVITGYCEKSLLPHLYSAAEMLVYPSLFEGFGLPPLEAMKSQTPVIASNRGSIPEVVADAALLVDPIDHHEIKTAIELLFHDQALKNALVLRGKQRAEAFSWKKTAKATREILAKAISTRE